MSAFAGLVGFGGRRPHRGEIERMGRALPALDQPTPSLWIGESAALAYRRLVITPEDRFERQPWSGSAGGSRLVFAGRLDNRDELALALGLDRERLPETADGALCLSAIERWGASAPLHLHGSFAFAHWDEATCTLLLARDRMGGRPLFYYRDRHQLAFATSFNALFALADVPRELDPVVVGDIVALNTFEPERTIYRGVLRVPSGCFATCTPAEVRVQAYWTPQPSPIRLRRHEDYVDAAREQLERAVAPMLRSERPVAAQCSGGLDSGAVGGTAARLLAPSRLAVFTRTPPSGTMGETDRFRFDEGPAVRALARQHPNIDLTLVDDAALHPIDLDPALRFAANGLPVFNPMNHGWFSATIDRVAAAGHRVLLDGQWGNYSLSWGGHSALFELFRRLDLAGLAREVRGEAHDTGRPMRDIVRQRLVPHLAPGMVRRRRRRAGLGAGLEHAGFVDPDFLRSADLAARIERDGGWVNGGLHRDPFAARVKWLVRSNEFGRDWTGQAPAFLGHEKRSPLGDPRLIEFCLNVPEAQYRRDGRARALARDVIRDRTPPEIHANRKHGLQSPEWFERLKPQREAVLRDVERIAGSPLASQIIDVKRLRAATLDWPATASELNGRTTELSTGLTRALHMGRFICWFEARNA